MVAQGQTQVQMERESPDSCSTPSTYRNWRPKQPFITTIGACALTIGLGVIALFLITLLMPGWKSLPFIGSLDYSPLLFAGVALTVIGLLILIASTLVGRTVPLKANIKNEVIRAFIDSQIIPKELEIGNYRHIVKVSRKNGIAYVHFRVQFPGRDTTTVLKQTRGIESAFSKPVSVEFIPTTGKYAKKYPHTLVLHFKEEQ